MGKLGWKISLFEFPVAVGGGLTLTLILTDKVDMENCKFAQDGLWKFSGTLSFREFQTFPKEIIVTSTLTSGRERKVTLHLQMDVSVRLAGPTVKQLKKIYIKLVCHP